jgi:hypothetical protein
MAFVLHKKLEVHLVILPQNSTRAPPEKVTVKGFIKEDETHHHGFAFVTDLYCWLVGTSSAF